MPVVSAEFWVQVQQFVDAVRRETDHVGEASFVQRTPGVCGGRACVRNTRITVWGVVQAARLGRTDADSMTDVPALTAADLDAVWAYYRHHSAEIEHDIAENVAENIAENNDESS